MVLISSEDKRVTSLWDVYLGFEECKILFGALPGRKTLRTLQGHSYTSVELSCCQAMDRGITLDYIA